MNLDLMKCSEAAAAIIRALQDKDTGPAESAAILAIALSVVARLTDHSLDDVLTWVRTCPVWDEKTQIIDLGDNRILMTNASTAEALAHLTPTKGTH